MSFDRNEKKIIRALRILRNRVASEKDFLDDLDLDNGAFSFSTKGGFELQFEDHNNAQLGFISGRRADKEAVLSACRRDGLALQYASEQMKADNEVVLAACKQNGDALQFASEVLRADKTVIWEACRQNGSSLEWAMGLDVGDKELVKMAVSHPKSKQHALQLVPKELRADKEVVRAACLRDGGALLYASPMLRKDKEFVLDVCKLDARAFQSAHDSMQQDKDVILNLCRHHGSVFRHIPTHFRNDAEIVLAACAHNGEALQFAPEHFRGCQKIVLAACRQNGDALRFASEELKADKEIVLAAAASNPNALKYALGGWNQDKDCLIAARLWDSNYRGRRPPPKKRAKTQSVADNGFVGRKIVLSTRFALAPDSPSKATQFTVLLKEHDFIRNGNFVVYSPNAFAKGTCDDKWTRYDWPCRGTERTCAKVSLYQEDETLAGVPKPDCCWRYSFRFQLEEAKRTNGFMLQLVEDMRKEKHDKVWQILGDGQIIEKEMAEQVGTKVFRVYSPVLAKQSREFEEDFTEHHIESVVARISGWYKGGCADMTDSTFTPIIDAV